MAKNIFPNFRFVDEEPTVIQVTHETDIDSLFPTLKSWTPEELEGFKTQVTQITKSLPHFTLRAFIEMLVSDLEFETDVFYQVPQTTQEDGCTYFGFNVVHHGLNIHVVFGAVDSNSEACTLTTDSEMFAHQSCFVVPYNQVGKEFVMSHINYVSNSIHSLDMVI